MNLRQKIRSLYREGTLTELEYRTLFCAMQHASTSEGDFKNYYGTQVHLVVCKAMQYQVTR